MTKIALSAPSPITEEHNLASFDCGVPSLNRWLQKCAFKNDHSGTSRTYVIGNNQTVIGYYCLATGAIGHTEAKAFGRNRPNPIPVLVLSRLAIHKDYHNQGIGRALLRDAVLRSLQASQIAGVSALLVHVLSETDRRFYLSNGLLESPISSRILYL